MRSLKNLLRSDDALQRPNRSQTAIAAVLALISALFLTTAHAALTAEEASWNQPVAPFRIMGDLYYVGASDITSYLIATPKGLILLDGGFAETAPQIESNIQALGFKLSDVKILLNSHAHYDHAGGLAALKAATHASFEVSAGDAPVLARGGKGDFFFGDTKSFAPVQADRILKDGDQVELGGVSLTAHVTAGHTQGCTTWAVRVMEGGKPYDVVFVCSATVLSDYRLVDHPSYPGIAADYARSFQVWKSLPCDVFLGAHGVFYDLQGKIARLQKHESGNPFVDPAGYRAYIDKAEQAFQQKLAAQRQAASQVK